MLEIAVSFMSAGYTSRLRSPKVRNWCVLCCISLILFISALFSSSSVELTDEPERYMSWAAMTDVCQFDSSLSRVQSSTFIYAAKQLAFVDSFCFFSITKICMKISYNYARMIKLGQMYHRSWFHALRKTRCMVGNKACWLENEFFIWHIQTCCRTGL